MTVMRKHRRLLTAVLAAACLGGTWLTVHHAPGEHGGEQRAQVPGGQGDAGGRTVTMKQALATLKVAEEASHEGYDREKFALYQDADGDGCDARREVLIAEAVEGPQVDRKRGCWLSHGEWYSEYDGKTLTNPQDVQIDHVVALNEAWQSGANKWPGKKLRQYGNYLADPRHLIGVSGPSNSFKSDKDPAEWAPSRDAFLCRFAADWVQIKAHWKLTVDVKEKAALDNLTGARNGKCGKTPVKL